MTQLEKRLLKEGFTPPQVERIMATVAGGSYKIYAVAKQVYAEWEKDFRYATNQKIELSALKRMLRLYRPEEIVLLAKTIKLSSIQNLESVAVNYVQRPTYSSEFEIQEGWKYVGASASFAKEAAYIAWQEQQENLQEETCQKKMQLLIAT